MKWITPLEKIKEMLKTKDRERAKSKKKNLDKKGEIDFN
jgi:hypothetical protein